MTLSIELSAVILLFLTLIGSLVKQAQRFAVLDKSMSDVLVEIEKLNQKVEYIISCYAKHDTELALTKQTINNLDLKIIESQANEKKNSEKINELKLQIKEL